MAAVPKIWALAQIPQLTLRLTETGDELEVIQFSTSYAVSEIPQAQCLVAVGRLVNAAADEAAAIHHLAAAALRTMLPVEVWLTMRGEYSVTGKPWPTQTLLFRGFLAGYGYRKSGDKLNAIMNLVHWTFTLGSSSCIIANSHPLSPWALTAPAVFDGTDKTGVSVQPQRFASAAVYAASLGVDLRDDVWGAIKKMFVTMTEIKANALNRADACFGGRGTVQDNQGARDALNRIEGGDTPYVFGSKLRFIESGLPTLLDAMALSIQQDTVESYAQSSFWDKLIGVLLPQFQLAFVPLPASGLVIANMPLYSGGYWRELRAGDYDAVEMDMNLDRPLKAVGVYAPGTSQTGVDAGYQQGTLGTVGGCFVAEAPANADGLVLYVPAPPWLANINLGVEFAGYTTGITQNRASPSETAKVGPPAPDQQTDTDARLTAVQQMYGRYAQAYFAVHACRGRSAVVSGKLRFDIAPGSIVKFKAKSERHLAEDELAFDAFGYVARTTLSINAEAALAATAFQLTNIRTTEENTDMRFSVAAHPLFDKSAIHGGGKHGCPLDPQYKDFL